MQVLTPTKEGFPLHKAQEWFVTGNFYRCIPPVRIAIPYQWGDFVVGGVDIQIHGSFQVLYVCTIILSLVGNVLFSTYYN